MRFKTFLSLFNREHRKTPDRPSEKGRDEPRPFSTKHDAYAEKRQLALDAPRAGDPLPISMIETLDRRDHT